MRSICSDHAPPDRSKQPRTPDGPRRCARRASRALLTRTTGPSPNDRARGSIASSGLADLRAAATVRTVSMSVPDSPSDLFLFHALMENTADSIYFKDRQCRLLRVSRKMAQDLGFSDPSELIGKTDVDLFGEAFGVGTQLDDMRIMESGRPIIGVVESRRPDSMIDRKSTRLNSSH